MGQSPFATFNTNPGGSKTALNMTAIGQIKNSRGALRKLLVQVAASAGTLTLTDMVTGGTPAIGNQVAAIPSAALTAGAIITVDAPFSNGIAITGTWPTALVLVATYD